MVALRMLAVAVLLLSASTAFAASLTASVDRRELFVNEHIVLTLALHDSETRLRAEGVSPNVDLTLLSDQFEVGIPRADFRFNLERNRGRSTSSITVELFPRHSGRLTIPPFTVDGLSTEAIVVEVLDRPAGAAAEAFAVSGIGARRLHVNEQTLVFLDLYHRVSLDSARFGGQVETRPQQVEMHALPQENRVETVDGIEYQVTRSAWALSPLRSGEVRVLLPDIWIETRQGRQWRLPHSEERIEVSPLPATAPPGLLIGRPGLDVEAPAEVVTGRMTPWSVTLRAPTALNALPATLPFAEHDDALRVFMEPPERLLEARADGGIDSVAVYRGALIALRPGTFALPGLALRWFDPGNGRIETLSVSGRPLRISGARVDADHNGAGAAEVARGVTAETRLWQAVAALLTLSWLVAGALWWRRRHRRGRIRGPGAVVPGQDPLQQRLLDALGTRTLEQGLRRHESAHGADGEVRELIRSVQRRRYHPGAADDPDDLEARVDRLVTRLRRTPPPAPVGELDEWSPRSFTRGNPADRD